jgi:hypothetical protein
VPLEEVIDYTEKGVPFQVSRLNTETMQIEDFYSLPKTCDVMSLQFIPRKKLENHISDIPESRNGYIFCSVINEVNSNYFRREMWLFDANNLKAGAVCVLSHADLDFSTTLHWLWMETAPKEKKTIITIGKQVIDLTQSISSVLKIVTNGLMKKYLKK